MERGSVKADPDPKAQSVWGFLPSVSGASPALPERQGSLRYRLGLRDVSDMETDHIDEPRARVWGEGTDGNLHLFTGEHTFLPGPL